MLNDLPIDLKLFDYFAILKYRFDCVAVSVGFLSQAVFLT